MIPDINLMPKLEKGESSPKAFYFLLIVLAIVTIGALMWLYSQTNNELTSLTSDRVELLITRDTLQQEVNSYETLNQGSLEESIAFVERVSYPVTPIIDETKGLLIDNAYLRSYEFAESGTMIIVDFETLNAISNYVSMLEKSPYFDDVQVGKIQNFEVNPSEEEKLVEQQFDEVPRYSVELNLMIDPVYVAAGGGNK